jgi:hypothetical protein
MGQPRQTSQFPSVGERRSFCTLQYATASTDTVGGTTETTWTEFGTWWTKVTVVPVVPDETRAVMLYQAEGAYRTDLLERFMSGTGLRLVTGPLTLKVMAVENPLLRNQTLIAHCAPVTS